jgi:hypothetical protein
MVDPVTTGISGAVARAAIDRILGYINESDSPEEAWKEAIRQCIKQARISFRQHYKDTKAPDFDRLKREIGNIGRSSQTLAVEGETEEYDEDLTGCIRDFAGACADYSGSGSWNNTEIEDEFEAQLNELGSKILDETE